LDEAPALKVRFTNHAVRQIDQVLDYIAARSPQGEKAVREHMREVVTVLEGHPYAGHPTSWRGVRRLALSPFPYVLDYRVAGDAIVIMRFRHGARRPL
jgi:toxin ParE1/3/4